MQKNKLIKGVFSALLLFSTVAGADQQYPAADFQPTIVYQDSNITKNSTTTAPVAGKQAAAVTTSNTADSKYPAADFQPQVVYSDPKAQHSGTVSVSTEVDSKYPAANFQPQVVYNDASYKSVSTSSNPKIQADTVDVVGSDATAGEKSKESDLNYLLVLIGLIAAGFLFFKSQGCPKLKKVEAVDSAASVKSSGGITGVARYLNRVSGTGVSRYLEQQAKTRIPATGVAKYVARQVISAKAAKAEAATGVEKYIRDRG